MTRDKTKNHRNSALTASDLIFSCRFYSRRRASHAQVALKLKHSLARKTTRTKLHRLVSERMELKMVSTLSERRLRKEWGCQITVLG